MGDTLKDFECNDTDYEVTVTEHQTVEENLKKPMTTDFPVGSNQVP